MVGKFPTLEQSLNDLKLIDIEKAQTLLTGMIRNTELAFSNSATQKIEKPIFFKFENTQRTGSFKIRGAYNKIAQLTEMEKAKGVVASSAGNHAQGVALSAQMAGVKATVVMPETASLNKTIATRAYGAEVILRGEVYDEAYEHARDLEKAYGLTFVHPYEDPLVIAGQGTVGLEILHSLKDVDTIIIPVGGGGLISGVSLAIKTLKPKCRIIGVISDQAPGMDRLFHGKSYEHPLGKKISTIADGIAIKRPSRLMYENFLKKYVDEIVSVSDDEIAEALVFLIERVKTLVEGSGAVGLAAMLTGKIKPGLCNCILLSGGNIDLNIIAKVIEKGQIRRGRLAELSVIVDDVPGSLHRLTKILSDEKANILQVHHDRVERGLFLQETRIDFVLETTSPEHILKIRQALEKMGAKVI